MRVSTFSYDKDTEQILCSEHYAMLNRLTLSRVKTENADNSHTVIGIFAVLAATSRNNRGSSGSDIPDNGQVSCCLA
jgi:hypothetical protein